jgi:hypothetical protein
MDAVDGQESPVSTCFRLKSASHPHASLWRDVRTCLVDPPPLAAFLRDPWAALLSTYPSVTSEPRPVATVLPFAPAD